MLGRKATPLGERILARVTKTDAGCWEWDTRDRLGYGRIWIGSRTDGSRRIKLAHVASYETFVGPVPDGLIMLDHLCRNPPCCNPEHLEPVTPRENVMRSPIAPASLEARQTHCLRGHEFTSENTYVNRGKRYCRQCIRIRGRR